MPTSLESCAKVSSFVTSDRLLLYVPRVCANPPPRFRRSVSLSVSGYVRDALKI